MSTKLLLSAATSRRRVLGISAAAAGLALLPFSAPLRAAARLAAWDGIALGVKVSIRIHHDDERVTEQALQSVVQELRRLEAVFSLYREDSALSQLNKRGSLIAPPAELVELLQTSKHYASVTDGAFDPTIQPLWQLYSQHFSKPGAAAQGRASVDRRQAGGCWSGACAGQPRPYCFPAPRYGDQPEWYCAGLYHRSRD